MVFCISLAEFLTFAATILVVLANIGQLTNNVVSRHIRMVEVDTTGFQDSLQATGATNLTGNIYASDQSAPVLQGNGLKDNYQWGIYTFCGGESTSGPRACDDSTVVYKWEPLQVLQQEVNSQYNQTISNALGQGRITDSEYLGKFSQAANYLLLIGTILTGLAFLTGFLAHRFAFALAALFALIAAATVGVGSAIWTAIAYKAKHSIPDNLDISVAYGNGLWMFWAAFVGDALAIVPFIISCCVGRSKY